MSYKPLSPKKFILESNKIKVLSPKVPKRLKQKVTEIPNVPVRTKTMFRNSNSQLRPDFGNKYQSHKRFPLSRNALYE